MPSVSNSSLFTDTEIENLIQSSRISKADGEEAIKLLDIIQGKCTQEHVEFLKKQFQEFDTMVTEFQSFRADLDAGSPLQNIVEKIEKSIEEHPNKCRSELAAFQYASIEETEKAGAKRVSVLKEIEKSLSQLRVRKDDFTVSFEALKSYDLDGATEEVHAKRNAIQKKAGQFLIKMENHIPNNWLMEGQKLSARIHVLAMNEDERNTVKNDIKNNYSVCEDGTFPTALQKEQEVFNDIINKISQDSAFTTTFFLEGGGNSVTTALSQEQATALYACYDAILERAYQLKDAGCSTSEIEATLSHINRKFWPPAFVAQIQAWRKVERELNAEERVKIKAREAELNTSLLSMAMDPENIDIAVDAVMQSLALYGVARNLQDLGENFNKVEFEKDNPLGNPTDLLNEEDKVSASFASIDTANAAIDSTRGLGNIEELKDTIKNIKDGFGFGKDVLQSLIEDPTNIDAVVNLIKNNIPGMESLSKEKIIEELLNRMWKVQNSTMENLGQYAKTADSVASWAVEKGEKVGEIIEKSGSVITTGAQIVQAVGEKGSKAVNVATSVGTHGTVVMDVVGVLGAGINLSKTIASIAKTAGTEIRTEIMIKKAKEAVNLGETKYGSSFVDALDNERKALLEKQAGNGFDLVSTSFDAASASVGLAATATTLAGVGPQAIGALPTATVLALTKIGIDVTSTFIKGAKKIVFMGGDIRHANIVNDLMQRAAAGDDIAREELISSSGIHAKTLMAVLALEGDPLATHFLVERGITEADLNNPEISIGVIRDLLMKKSSQTDSRGKTWQGIVAESTLGPLNTLRLKEHQRRENQRDQKKKAEIKAALEEANDYQRTLAESRSEEEANHPYTEREIPQPSDISNVADDLNDAIDAAKSDGLYMPEGNESGAYTKFPPSETEQSPTKIQRLKKYVDSTLEPLRSVNLLGKKSSQEEDIEYEPPPNYDPYKELKYYVAQYEKAHKDFTTEGGKAKVQNQLDHLTTLKTIIVNLCHYISPETYKVGQIHQPMSDCLEKLKVSVETSYDNNVQQFEDKYKESKSGWTPPDSTDAEKREASELKQAIKESKKDKIAQHTRAEKLAQRWNANWNSIQDAIFLDEPDSGTSPLKTEFVQKGTEIQETLESAKNLQDTIATMQEEIEELMTKGQKKKARKKRIECQQKKQELKQKIGKSANLLGEMEKKIPSGLSLHEEEKINAELCASTKKEFKLHSELAQLDRSLQKNKDLGSEDNEKHLNGIKEAKKGIKQEKSLQKELRDKKIGKAKQFVMELQMHLNLQGGCVDTDVYDWENPFTDLSFTLDSNEFLNSWNTLCKNAYNAGLLDKRPSIKKAVKNVRAYWIPDQNNVNNEQRETYDNAITALTALVGVIKVTQQNKGKDEEFDKTIDGIIHQVQAKIAQYRSTVQNFDFSEAIDLNNWNTAETEWEKIFSSAESCGALPSLKTQNKLNFNKKRVSKLIVAFKKSHLKFMEEEEPKAKRVKHTKAALDQKKIEIHLNEILKDKCTGKNKSMLRHIQKYQEKIGILSKELEKFGSGTTQIQQSNFIITEVFIWPELNDPDKEQTYKKMYKSWKTVKHAAVEAGVLISGKSGISGLFRDVAIAHKRYSTFIEKDHKKLHQAIKTFQKSFGACIKEMKNFKETTSNESLKDYIQTIVDGAKERQEQLGRGKIK
ncbi:MAG: hypothetical protein CL916_08920 [Deltaproteobacteria bacterium]|nr:hypothetical protein [Deltaproteobacteria bacterium]